MNIPSRNLLLVVALLAGCGTGTPTPPTDSSVQPARSEVSRGPVTLTVELSADSIRLSDEPVLTVTVEAEAGVVVTAPPFGQSVGEFLVRDYQEPVSPPRDGRDVIRQIYTLEPTRVGTLTIAPVKVVFEDTRTDENGRSHEVESEALNIDVTTVIGDSAPSLNDLKPSTPPVELPSSGPPAWVWLAVGAVSGAVGLMVWLLRRRRQQARRKPPLTPQQLAHLELDQIIAKRLAESDIKTFYTELTGVVRRYIERSTGVRAPEQTTEEFLHEILAGAVFAEQEQRRLRQFLESADLVKFAGHQPAPDDVEISLTRAREFTQLNSAAAEGVDE